MEPAAPAPASSSLRYHEALRVGWLITWRQALIVGLASWIVMPILALALVGFLTTIGVPDSVVNSGISLIPILILPAFVQPILFLMAVNKDYHGFRIEALREDGLHQDLTLLESIAPALILWVGGSIILFPILVAIQVTTPLAMNQYLFLFVVTPAIQVLVAYPMALWLLFRFHRARFHSFRFDVVRDGE